MISGIRAYARHLRDAKFCMRGGREWFADRGWSWAEFVREGRPVEELEATGDALAIRVAAVARAESNG